MLTRLFYNTIISMPLLFCFGTNQVLASWLDEIKHQVNSHENIIHSSNLHKKAAAYNYLSDLYRNIDYDKTILLANSALSTQVFKMDNLNRIFKISSKYETTEKAKEIKNLNFDLNSHSNIQVLFYISTGLLTVLLIVIIILLKMRSQSLNQFRKLQDKEQELKKLRLQKMKTEQIHIEKNIFAEQQINKLQRKNLLIDIDYKNRELAQLTLGIINKNNVLLRIKELLQNDPSINGKNTNLYSYVSSNIDSNQNWYEFKKSFEKTNPGFFDRLNRKFPDLTDSDIKLCAYLKLKLTSKEIAQLMHINEVSISKKRNRMRKKLQLIPEEDLHEWLRSI